MITIKTLFALAKTSAIVDCQGEFRGLLLGSQCTFIRGENQKNKLITSSPVEALILFNEECQGLLKLQVPFGWEWGRME